MLSVDIVFLCMQSRGPVACFEHDTEPAHQLPGGHGILDGRVSVRPFGVPDREPGCYSSGRPNEHSCSTLDRHSRPDSPRQFG